MPTEEGRRDRFADVFTVAVLKGAVEGDVYRHFGSLGGVEVHLAAARRLGLIDSEFHPTVRARDLYRQHGLDHLPAGRAYPVWHDKGRAERPRLTSCSLPAMPPAHRCRSVDGIPVHHAGDPCTGGLRLFPWLSSVASRQPHTARTPEISAAFGEAVGRDQQSIQRWVRRDDLRDARAGCRRQRNRRPEGNEEGVNLAGSTLLGR